MFLILLVWWQEFHLAGYSCITATTLKGNHTIWANAAKNALKRLETFGTFDLDLDRSAEKYRELRCLKDLSQQKQDHHKQVASRNAMIASLNAKRDEVADLRLASRIREGEFDADRKVADEKRTEANYDLYDLHAKFTRLSTLEPTEEECDDRTEDVFDTGLRGSSTDDYVDETEAKETVEATMEAWKRRLDTRDDTKEGRV